MMGNPGISPMVSAQSSEDFFNLVNQIDQSNLTIVDCPKLNPNVTVSGNEELTNIRIFTRYPSQTKDGYGITVDFSPALDLRSWVRVSHKLPSGNYLDCTQPQTLVESDTLYGEDSSDLLQNMIDNGDLEYIIRVIRINPTTMEASYCKSHQCLQLSPCNSLPPDFSEKVVDSEEYAPLIYVKTTKTTFEPIGTKDASFTKTSMVDPFRSPEWRDGHPTVFRWGDSPSRGIVQSTLHRPIVIYPADVATFGGIVKVINLGVTTGTKTWMKLAVEDTPHFREMLPFIIHLPSVEDHAGSVSGFPSLQCIDQVIVNTDGYKVCLASLLTAGQDKIGGCHSITSGGWVVNYDEFPPCMSGTFSVVVTQNLTHVTLTSSHMILHYENIDSSRASLVGGGGIVIPVVTSNFEEQSPLLPLSPPLVHDNFLVSEGKLHSPYPELPLCSSNFSISCSPFGDPCDEDRGICGVRDFDVSFSGHAEKVWSSDMPPASTIRSYLGHPGNIPLSTYYSSNHWPVTTRRVGNEYTSFDLPISITYAIALSVPPAEHNHELYPHCPILGNIFAVLNARTSPTEEGIVSTSVTMSEISSTKIVEATIIGSKPILSRGTLFAFDGTPIYASEWGGERWIRLRLKTRQAGGTPGIPIIHDAVMEATDVKSGRKCQFRGYHTNGFQSDISYSKVTENDAVTSISAIANGVVESKTLGNGRALVVSSEYTNTWESTTNIFMIGITPECWSESTDFSNPAFTKLDYSFHSVKDPATSIDALYAEYGTGTYFAAYVSEVESLNTKVTLLKITKDESSALGMISSSRIITNSATSVSTSSESINIGPRKFNTLDFGSRVIDDLQQTRLSTFDVYSYGSSFIHGFSLINCTEGIMNIQDLETLGYEIDRDPDTGYMSLNPSSLSIPTDSRLRTHHPSVRSLEKTQTCLQPFEIVDVYGQSGINSNFMVSTVETEVTAKEGDVPFAELGYIVACLTKRGDTMVGEEGSITSVGESLTACTDTVPLCKPHELTVHLMAGPSKSFVDTDLCMETAFSTNHYDLSDYGERCATSASGESSDVTLREICTDLSCSNTSVHLGTCGSSELKAFTVNYEVGKHFRHDYDTHLHSRTLSMLSTFTIDMGLFSRVASSLRLKQVFHVGVASGERRSIVVNSNRRVSPDKGHGVALGESTSKLRSCRASYPNGDLRPVATSSHHPWCAPRECLYDMILEKGDPDNGYRSSVACVRNLVSQEEENEGDTDTSNIIIGVLLVIVIVGSIVVSFVIWRLLKNMPMQRKLWEGEYSRMQL